MARDYYKVLEIARDASPEEVKRAYRRLALKYHPDQNPGDREAEERFKAINEAYHVLSDPHRRRQYDLFGTVQIPEAIRDFGQSVGSFFEKVLGDVFKRKKGERGKDMKYQLEVTLAEVASGVDKEIVVPRVIQCVDCGGAGAKQGTTVGVCEMCDGSGEVRVQQGFVRLSKRCGTCYGRGRVFQEACVACAGRGERDGEVRLSVHVPAGIADGQRLRLAGEGERGKDGGECGDLFVHVAIAKQALLRREGTEIHCEVPVSFGDVALGAEIAVPTLGGVVRLKLPRGTQSGTVFRIAGEGLPRNPTDGPRGVGERGDEHVRVVVETPLVGDDARDADVRAALERLRRVAGPRGQEYRDAMRAFYKEEL